jgi:hypothetical protein
MAGLVPAIHDLKEKNVGAGAWPGMTRLLML